MIGVKPLGGLVVVPFTLFGSFALLLPVYLWFSGGRQGNQTKGYGAVIAAGILGGPAIMMMLSGGPFSGARFLSMASLQFYGIGSAFGFGSAVSWIAAHHFTSSLSLARNVR